MTELILLDSSFNLKELKKLIHNTDYKIITFDFESHKSLKDNGINHSISDEYLSIEDFEKINKKSFDFVNGLKKKKSINY